MLSAHQDDDGNMGEEFKMIVDALQALEAPNEAQAAQIANELSGE